MFNFYDNLPVFYILGLPLIVIGIQLALLYTRGNPAKHLKWKSLSIKTRLSQEEFNLRVREICLHKRLLLLEVSATHAYIKQSPSVGNNWGAYYYIELSKAAETTVTVWCCSGLTIDLNNFRQVWLIDMVNNFYTV